jgi:DNA-binding LacI/PurR family transcriptional regulator
VTSPRTTISDVARAAGVSKGAVSFALNGRPGVSSDTRDRILAAARELGWTPSHRARALAASRALAVGLIIARPPETLGSDPFFPGFIAGVETVLSGLGQALVLQVVPDQERELAGYRRLAASGRVDGVFLTDLRVDDPRHVLLAELGLPSVCICPEARTSDPTCIAVDDRPGITAAVCHLVDLGHRRIAHVAGPDEFVHGVSRREAWGAALEAAGLPEGPCIRSDFSAQGGAEATKLLLDQPDPPTAIVYANDLMAIAGMAAVNARGLDVPHHLSITGFDDIEVSAHLQPSLTTVRTDAYAWGRAAADCLMAVLEGREAPNVVLPPPSLVIRASTAPPRTERSLDRRETEIR